MQVNANFEAARERIRAQGYRPGIEAARLRFVDSQEMKFWQRQKREAEKKEREIAERIQRQRDDREQRKQSKKLRAQLHRSLSRYEELPGGV